MSASTNITITINSSAATSIALNPLVNFSTLTAPVAAGTPLYSIVVSPPGWSGSLALTGSDASLFVINSSNQFAVGSAPLPAGTYDVTVTASP